MAGLLESAKERKKRDQEYKKRIFPFGDEQREQELALLRELVTAKVEDNERIYHLIQLRDLLQTEEEPEELLVQLKKWYGNRYTQYLPKEQRARVYALALLTQNRTSPEDCPTAEAVLEKAEELLAGEMADWPEKTPRASVFSWKRRK